MPEPLRVEPGRLQRIAVGSIPETKILVRAQGTEGEWANADIAELDRDSLLRWLRRYPARAELVLLVLLGHPTDEMPRWEVDPDA
jgi:hypothetical protein